MKNNLKKQRGITLISLAITILVLIILASVATYSGKSVINSTKLTAFTTEMKIMQSEVNKLYERKKSGEDVSSYGTSVEVASSEVQEQANKVFTSSASGITDYSGYKFFSQETIKSLDIEGVDQEVFVNIDTRSVVSYQGFRYEGNMYYTLEQLPNGLYNVEYQENTNKPTFNVTKEQISENKWKITISNVEYDGNINKWKVKYKLEEQEYWSTSEDLEIVINKLGIYTITVFNEDTISDEKKIAVGVAEQTPENSDLATLATMSYGVIEVEFLSGTSYTVGDANNPSTKLKDEMEAVYWAKDETGKIDTTSPANNTYLMTTDNTNFNIANWYQYKAQTGSNDGKTSRWANATTSDGSYYVWIPRYAYRIIYFDTPEHEDAYRAGTLTEEEALANNYIVGYSDARGIVDKDGKRPTDVTSTTSISVNDKYFRTHPAFDGNTEEGGWNSKLEGIWVMKYEASRNDATSTSIGSGTIPKSVPNVKSWGDISVSTMFTYARDAYNNVDILNTTLNSHMMKNSEWGAVAYLTESKYGRNGTEISVNQCKGYITGAGRGTGNNQIYNSTYAVNTDTKLPEADQQYTGTIGQLSSTTGNIYGISDISGGRSEYVMGFYGTNNNTPTFGYSGFTTTTFPSERKYYQIYSKTSSYGSTLGDALYETKGWNGDVCSYLVVGYPTFCRGGYGNSSSGGSNGAFGFYNGLGGGDTNFSRGFRLCLCVM